MDSPADGFFLTNGESVALAATAYDKAQDDKTAERDGKEVPVSPSFMSSDDSVIEIDGSEANAVGVGSAKITAHYGDVASKAITINVTPGGDVTHKLTYTIIAASKRTFTRIYQTDGETLISNDPVRGPSYDPGDDATAAGSGGVGENVVFTVQVREYDSEGNAPIDEGFSGSITATIQQQGSVLGAVASSVSVGNPSAGIVQVTVNNDGDGSQITGEGTARIILSLDGADDIALPAVIVKKQVLEEPS